MNVRDTQLSHWLSSLFPKKTLSLQPLEGDAGFRRYFRCYHPEGTYIAMDAPPEKNVKSLPFIRIAEAFQANGINAPKLHQSNLDLGFLLLDDFGDITYLEALKTQNPHLLYQQAIQTLIQIQFCQSIPNFDIPLFDADFIIMELERFDDWFIHQLLELSLHRSEQKILNEVYERLIQSALSQSQVLVHRDYHSRNLMFVQQNSPGVLDFQDAMMGPITYDLVSLLKDCYIQWPESLVDIWVDYYFNQAKASGLLNYHMTETQFSHAFDLMGIQRHLKVLGNFSWLHLRDQKSAYLSYIPLTIQYLLNASNRYEEFEDLHWLLQTVILPKLLFPKSPSFHRDMIPRTTLASISSIHSLPEKMQELL